MKLAVVSALALAMFLAVSAAPAVQGADETVWWLYAADWDAGTASTYNGVETLVSETDSESYARESTSHDGLYNANIYSDYFRVRDADAQTWRWLAPSKGGCTDNGAEWISNLPSGWGDGSLNFAHNSSGTAETSTRTTRAPVVAFAGLEVRLRFNWAVAAGGNFTVAATSLNSTSDVTAWCGSYSGGAMTGGGFEVSKTTGTADDWTYRAWVATNSIPRYCGQPRTTTSDRAYRIERASVGNGTEWRFYWTPIIGPPGWQFLSACTVQATAPEYVTFSLDTNAAATAYFTVDRYFAERSFGTGAAESFMTIGNGINGYGMNWTSPDFGTDSQYIRTLRLSVDDIYSPGNCEPGVTGPGWIDFTIFYASDDSVAWNPGASYLGCSATYDISALGLDPGPYYFRVNLDGSGTYPEWLSGVQWLLTGEAPGGPGGPPPATDFASSAAWFSGIIGCAVFALIAVMIITITSTLLRRR